MWKRQAFEDEKGDKPLFTGIKNNFIFKISLANHFTAHYPNIYLTQEADMAAMGMVARTDELTIAQQGAIESLRNGCSFVRAAQDAGVSRSTLYRWVESDPAFKAAYNAWQSEMAESARARLLKLTDQAVDVVEAALRRNDEKTAIQMLKDLGVMRRRRRGSTDAEVVGLQIDLQKGREHRKASTDMMRHLLGKAGVPRSKQLKFIRNPGEAFMARLDQLNQMKDEAGTDENGTPGTNEGNPGAADPADAPGQDTANPLPGQDIRSNLPLRNEGPEDGTLDGAPRGVSHDSDERASA